MGLSQDLAVAALIISILSAGIAFGSLWRTHLAGFRPSVVTGDVRLRVYTIESEGAKWYLSSFDLPLTVVNEGALSGTVLDF